MWTPPRVWSSGPRRMRPPPAWLTARVRWIVDDCIKFVQREIRRGNRYDIVILDPPSYGRGPKGEIWHLEDNLYDFVTLVQQVLSENALAVVLNSYTTGLSAR